MAIADRIYALRQRPTYELRINGVLIVPDQPLSLDGRPAAYSMRGGESYDSPVPYLNIEVSRIPRWMRRGMSVTLDAGYDGEHVRLFTGGVWALGEEDPDYLRTQCIGTGATDADGDRIERTASIIGGPAVWPPIPAGQYIDFGIDNHLIHDNTTMEEAVTRELGRRARVPRRPYDSKERQTISCKGDLYGAFRDFKIPARDVSGEDLDDAIEGVLDDSGVATYNVNIPAYTLAAEGATLDRMNGAGMLEKLMQVKGARIQQLKSGLVIVRVIEEQPAPTAAFTYSTTDQQYARIITAEPPLMRVPFNPLLQIGMTGALELDYLGIDGRYFLYSHEWEIGSGGAFSYVDLRGGDEFGGTIGINPVASFTYAVAAQVIGTELYYVITFTDTSIDPDGTIDQAASTWATNQTTIPDISDFDGEPVATIRIAVADVVGDFEVTRHVEDNDGLTDDYTEAIDLSATSSAVTIPPFYVAAGTRRMATPDGGQTFNDTTPASKTATAVGARLADGVNTGHGVFGHSDGSLDVTRDSNATVAAALAAVGGTSPQFMDVVWDWRDHRLVWAITDDARLYLSNDEGATFFLYANFRTLTYGGFGGTTPGALGNIIGLPAGGGVYVFGGDGAGRPMIAFNTNLLAPTWLRVTFTGDLQTDLVTPADATMRIVGFSAPGYDGADMILSWASGGEATLVAIYRTTDAPGLSANYSRATGLTAGLKNGRVMMESGPLSPIGRIALFGDRDVWRRPMGSNAWTEISDVLPAGFTPNHGLFGSSVLTPLSLVYEHLLAVEDATGTGGVMKSTDEAETFNFLRGPSTLVSWVAGAKAKKIAIGAPASTTPGGSSSVAAITTSASPRTVTKLTGATWSPLVAATGITDSNPELFCLSPDLWFATNHGGGSGDVTGTASRSTDGGQTWAANLAGGFGFVRAPDGRLWAFARVTATFVQTQIWYSDDDGANWTLSTTIGNGTSQLYGALRIACHPTNANVIAVWGEESVNSGFVTATDDRGGSWTTTTSGVPDQGQDTVSHTYQFAILANGRFVWAGATSSNVRRIYTSDDNGVTWTQRYTETDSAVLFTGIGFSGAKVIVYRDDGTTGKPLISNDSGASWALAGCDSHQTFTGDATSHSDSAVYDAAADALYCAMSGTSATYRVLKLTPVSDAGVWSNVTYNIASGSFGNSNLSVVPVA